MVSGFSIKNTQSMNNISVFVLRLTYVTDKSEYLQIFLYIYIDILRIK